MVYVPSKKTYNKDWTKSHSEFQTAIPDTEKPQWKGQSYNELINKYDKLIYYISPQVKFLIQNELRRMELDLVM